MELMERLELLSLGCLIGFVFGYIVRTLTEIKEELEEVDDCVKRIRDERGVITRRITANIALFLVVSLTLYASIVSQLASNKSNDVSASVIVLQTEQKQNLDCTTQFLSDAIRALNERTTFSSAQSDANIDLVQAQYDLIIKGQKPNLSPEEQQQIFNEYIHQVKRFLDLAEKTKDQQLQNPFPTVSGLNDCLTRGPEETKESK